MQQNIYWNDHLCDAQLQTKWDNSQCDPRTRTSCGVGSAHNFANSTAILTTTLSLGYSLKRLVGYSLWVHLRIPSIIIFFEVPRIASQYRTMLLETNCICEDFATTEGDDKHDQNLVLVKRNHNGNSGKTTMFIFFSSHVVFKLLHDYLILSSLELTHIWFRFGHKSRLVYCPKIQQWAMMCYKDSYLGPGGCTQC